MNESNFWLLHARLQQRTGMRKEAYEKGSKIGYSHTCAMLTELKKRQEFAFLKEVDSIALQQSLRDLDRGFVNFFQKRAAHPVLKNKNNRHQSYRTINQRGNIRIVGRYIKLPKLGFVKIGQSMQIGKINNVTIKHTKTGKYFAVLNVEFEPLLRPNNGGVIGIDVGIKEFYSDGNGTAVSNPKYLEKSMRKLIREQRKLSRKRKGSNNRNKQCIKVALIHEKITNQRNDFLQKQSTMLIRENQTICIEELRVRNMMRNHKLAQQIGSVSWSKFFDMLAYKSVWYGNDLVKVPTMYHIPVMFCATYRTLPLTDRKILDDWILISTAETYLTAWIAGINILNKDLFKILSLFL